MERSVFPARPLSASAVPPGREPDRRERRALEDHLPAPVHRMERREALQRARIHAGWRRHDLTRRELWRLRSGQWRIDRMQRRAWRDGGMSRIERRHIERMEDRQNWRIHRLRHNDRERWL